jgi:glyoxylase-like metal-dependent hydrolase (beta-lactamase superfamily II)
LIGVIGRLRRERLELPAEQPMQILAPQTTLIDTEYLSHREAIACCLLEAGGAAALVDPGPTTSLLTLKAKLAARGIAVGDLTALLLTHIHLDHAGATGVLVRENPRLRVYVHQRGAPHMIDPSKLLASATRLYGDQMERLWGEVAAVPAANVAALAGGETIELGSRRVEVAATPGHATHHVSYFDEPSGIAFVGDTAGLRYPEMTTVLPLTPPPDIDLDAWRASLAEIRRRRPAQLFVTHFGPSDDIEAHLAQHEARLESWAEWVRRSLENDQDDAERAARFAAEFEAELARELDARELKRYARGAALEQCWYGLARYWRRHPP